MIYLLYQALHEGWQDRDALSFTLPPQFLTEVPVAILLAYVNLLVLMPAFFYQRKYMAYVSSLLLLLVSGGLVARYCTYAIWIPWDRLHDHAMYASENKNFFIPVRILKNAVEAYPVVAITMLIKLMRDANRNEKRMREMEKEKFAAEMGLLKAQINPHFFFNTLNSLYALTLKGSEHASKMVLRLSELMNYMLHEASQQQVSLESEIKHLENYIVIEQMRFADRLSLSFQYSGDIVGKSIAPLLLLPFVENTFKHGITEDYGWITISLKVSGRQLFFKAQNSYPQVQKTRIPGVGLINVTRRLELIYPQKYKLQIMKNPDSYEIELDIKL